MWKFSPIRLLPPFPTAPAFIHPHTLQAYLFWRPLIVNLNRPSLYKSIFKNKVEERRGLAEGHSLNVEHLEIFGHDSSTFRNKLNYQWHLETWWKMWLSCLCTAFIRDGTLEPILIHCLPPSSMGTPESPNVVGSGLPKCKSWVAESSITLVGNNERMDTKVGQCILIIFLLYRENNVINRIILYYFGRHIPFNLDKEQAYQSSFLMSITNWGKKIGQFGM